MVLFGDKFSNLSVNFNLSVVNFKMFFFLWNNEIVMFNTQIIVQYMYGESHRLIRWTSIWIYLPDIRVTDVACDRGDSVHRRFSS